MSQSAGGEGMNWPRAVIIVGVAISLGLSAHYLLKDKELRDVSPLLPLYGKAELKMKKLHLEEKKGRQKRWQLDADMAESFRDSGLTFLNNVKLIYFKGDDENFVISGKTGVLDNKTYSMTINGDVRVKGPEGFELLSSSLVWDPSRGLIRTEDDVDLKSQSVHLKGKGLTSTSDLVTMEINGSVRALMRR